MEKSGCGWCDDNDKCSDYEETPCKSFAHGCDSDSDCGFDGGAFVGGMFLVIGVGLLAGGAYMFYRYKTQTQYKELN